MGRPTTTTSALATMASGQEGGGKVLVVAFIVNAYQIGVTCWTSYIIIIRVLDT
jgi:hypothetical protein